MGGKRRLLLAWLVQGCRQMWIWLVWVAFVCLRSSEERVGVGAS